MVVDLPALIREAEAAATLAEISIDELCQKIGINRGTWTRWKAGRNAPTIDGANRVSQVTQDLLAARNYRLDRAPSEAA